MSGKDGTSSKESEPLAKIRLLWVDLTQVASDEAALAACEQRFITKKLSGRGFDSSAVLQEPVHGVVLEYDFPDRASLNILRVIKQSYPSIPVIMLTEQHSEALAVWAFRARVWDYLIKPIKAWQILRLHADLVQLNQLKACGRSQVQMVRAEERLPEDMRIGDLAAPMLLLRKAQAYINDHLSEKICLDQMAAMCGMSPYRFSRMFKKVYGHTFQEYLLLRRVDEAARLLQNPSSLIVDVAFLTGFRDPSYFARIFKRYTGFSPGEFRQQENAPSPALFCQPELPFLD